MARKLLKDNPVIEDQLSGKGHERTATALANEIAAFGDETHSIGLEGKWGAGKSTIVELARRKLEEKKDKRYHVFTFDLWSNQTSSFRRSFLEALLNWIDCQKELTEDKRKDTESIRNLIRGKTIKTETTNRKVFDVFGVVFIVFALFLPSIYQWLSPSVILGPEKVPPISAFYILFIMLIAVLFVCRAAKKFFKQKKRNVITAISEAITLFSRDAEIVYEEKTISEQDPSQAEFYETFQTILNIYQTENRKIVIVIDNVDRLTKTRLLDAWSDIRTIMHNYAKPGLSKQNIIIVVPYDRDHVLSAFESENNNGAEKQTSVTDDIIRKSFDSVFHVSPPVLSDESKFFEIKLKEAAGGNDEGSSYQLYKIFEQSIASQTFPATPRQIIHFINQVTSLKEQWEQIPLPDIAVFVANSEKLYTNPTQLRDRKTINQQYRDIANSKDLDRNLAALSYNVEPELAFQVLLYNEIEKRFTQPKSAELEELMKAPGVHEMLPQVINQKAADWAKNNAIGFGNVVENLNSPFVASEVKNVCKPDILRNISLLGSLEWEKWEEYLPILSVIDLADKIDVSKTAKVLKVWLKNPIKGNSVDDDELFHLGCNWIRYVDKLYAKLVSNFENSKKADEEIKSINFPASAPFILGAAYYSNQTQLRLKKFDVKLPEEFFSVLKNYIQNNPEYIQDAITEIYEYLNEQQLNELIDVIYSNIMNNKWKNDSNIASGIKILAFLVETHFKENKKLPDNFVRLIEDGIIFKIAFLEKEKDKPDFSIISAALALFIRVYPDLSTSHIRFEYGRLGSLVKEANWIQQVKLGQELPQPVIDEVADFIIKQNRITSAMTEVISGNGSQSFYVKLLTSVASKENIHFQDHSIFIKNYSILKQKIPSIKDKFLALVGENLDVNILDDLELADLSEDLIKDILTRKEEGWINVLNWIDQQFKTLPGDEWKVILKNEQHIVNIYTLTVDRHSSQGEKRSSDVLNHALVNHCIEICLGNEVETTNFDHIFCSLTDGDKALVRRLFLNGLKGSNTIADGIVNLWTNCPNLMEGLPLTRHPEISVEQLIIPLFNGAFKGKEELIKCLCKNLTKMIKSLVDNNHQDIIDDLKQRLDNAKNDLNDKKDEDGLRFIDEIAKKVADGAPKKRIKTEQ